MEVPGVEELGQFLEQARGAAEVDSEGAFSLDRQRALRMMAKKSLPYPYAWMVALGQAVFHCGSPSLEVNLTRQEILFKFQYGDAPSIEEVERTFQDPTSSGPPAWQRLRQAVWGAALGENREVSLCLGERRFQWAGETMEVCPLTDSLGSEVRLSVSLRAKASFWQALALIRIRAELSREVRVRFFASPFQVVFDGLRIDGLHRNPTNGFSSKARPFQILWFQGEEELLALPPAQEERWAEPYPQSPARFLSGNFESLAPRGPVEGAVILAAHVSTGHEHAGGGGDTMWATPRQSSKVYWIREGVTLRREKLPLGSLAVSAALILSADGLRSDLTGFGLEEAGLEERRRHYLRQLNDGLRILEWDPELADLSSRAKVLKGSLGSLALGLAGLPFTHGVSFVLVMVGIAGVILDSGLATVQRILVRDYARMREQLLENYGPTDSV